MREVEEIKRLLAACTGDQRREIFDHLRQEFQIHPLESKLNVSAEVILEAIDRASDLTQRGIRGIIAELTFQLYVVSALTSWSNESLVEDLPYDFLLQDSTGQVRVQVKMQRRKKQRPMLANKRYGTDMYVVETQRTRGGTDPQTGADTRPLRFGEFDILAVSMYPSTNEWSAFMYTVSDWLLPRPEDPTLILKLQPVAKAPNEVWTNDFETCVRWLRSGQKRRIWEPPKT